MSTASFSVPRFHKPQDMFLAGEGDANGHHHGHSGEGLSIKKDGNDVQLAKVTFLKPFELLGAGVGKAPRHRRTRQANGPRDRGGRGLIC